MTHQSGRRAIASLDWRGRPLRLEYRWVGDAASPTPPVVFLHEGLGSVAMWKDFPERFCADARLARPGVLALRLRPLDAEAGR